MLFISDLRIINNYFSVEQQYFQDSVVPVLIVGCKAEHKEVVQDHEVQPPEFCQRNRLSPPVPYTCVDKINKDVYAKLATMAAYP